jgi:hypothetical protein
MQQQQQQPVALIVNPQAALGQALSRAASLQAHVRIVEKRDLLGGDAIAAQAGVVFHFNHDAQAVLPLRFGSTFRAAVVLVNTAKLDVEHAFAVQTRVDRKVVVLVAHGADEAAEFVIRYASAMADARRRDAARAWLLDACNASTADPRAFALRVAEALPIPPDQAAVLLESCGSLGAVAGLRTVAALLQKTPLSNQHARDVAQAMFLVPLQQHAGQQQLE